MNRPSPRELCGKITNAIQAIESGRSSFGTMRHWPGDREELDINTTSELWPLLIELLGEINKLKPDECYAGQRPPTTCYHDEKSIKDEDLWPFAWFSTKFQKKMYLKFVLKKNGKDEWCYYHIDCHPSRV